MKIFLSWSGPRSRAIAEALNDWLKRVIQAVKPFYSPEIEKGAKWSGEIDAALEGTRFGIICLTPDNLESRWIHYEAGALSKTGDALIWTFLHGIKPGDVPQPLGKFQHTIAEKNDVLMLLNTINKRLADVGGEPIDNAVLSENFELYWPKLGEKLEEAEKLAEQKPESVNHTDIDKSRDEREILLEILELVRSQQRNNPSVPTILKGSIARKVRLITPPESILDDGTVDKLCDRLLTIFPSGTKMTEISYAPYGFDLFIKGPIPLGFLSRIRDVISDVGGVEWDVEFALD